MAGPQKRKGSKQQREPQGAHGAATVNTAATEQEDTTPTSTAAAISFTFVLTLSAYCLTAYPGLPPGDAGELITAAHQLGGAHPPGYPLFTLLGSSASRLVPFW